jgi:DnaJ-class molecular chaperone
LIPVRFHTDQSRSSESSSHSSSSESSATASWKYEPVADRPSPYDILDLPISATESEIKKQYRKKSLMIHPDKFKHEKGLEVRLFLLYTDGHG